MNFIGITSNRLIASGLFIPISNGSSRINRSMKSMSLTFSGIEHGDSNVGLRKTQSTESIRLCARFSTGSKNTNGKAESTGGKRGNGNSLTKTLPLWSRNTMNGPLSESESSRLKNSKPSLIAPTNPSAKSASWPSLPPIGELTLNTSTKETSIISRTSFKLSNPKLGFNKTFRFLAKSWKLLTVPQTGEYLTSQTFGDVLRRLKNFLKWSSSSGTCAGPAGLGYFFWVGICGLSRVTWATQISV